ncbi:hypothetical protein [Ancrocorticia populi]|uniref:hypothetical protein n=1 Tax=Ancrocorticia populi TaxID=2175228 RepID=UPI003F976F29
MTRIIIDATDAGGVARKGDQITFYAPEIRPGPGSRITHTRAWTVELTSGKATVENVVPGPIVVRVITAGAPRGNAEFKVVVPDQESVTLADLLTTVYEYTPEVTSASVATINGARDAGLQAVSQAQVSAVAAVNAAATNRASLMWNFAGTGTPVLAAFPGIKVGDTIRRTSDGQEWAAGQGTVTPLPNLIPRIDTTVGTRVFIGSTMVYGDTGWRNVTSLLANGWTADYVHIRRVGDVVTVRANRLGGSAATNQTFLNAIAGFRPSSSGTTSFLITHGSEAAVAARWDYVTLGIPTYSSYTSGRASEISVTTRDTWPTSLPGTPA